MSDDPRVHEDDAPPSTWKKGNPATANGSADFAKASVVARAVTINRPAGQLFAYFRDFANLPTFMENIVSIEVIDAVRSHWVVKAPAGKTVQWDACVTDEEKDRYIAWSSVPGADIANSGRIEFRDVGARGTVVTATIAYDPPGGTIGKLVAKMFQREPAIQARRDLRRFKQLMETGEIATAAFTKAQLEEEDA